MEDISQIKKKGNHYISVHTGLVVKCLEDSDQGSFRGEVVSGGRSTGYNPGYITDTWISNIFTLHFESNNGWTKLISEKDLPKEDGVYIIGNMGSFGNFKENENKTNLSWLVYQFSHKKITHYKLYISLPPKF